MRFSIFIVIIFLFELISCSSTKYHTLKEVLVKVNKANYNQEPNVYIFGTGDSIKRGPWSSCKLNEGNIIDEVEDAVVLQTIGKIQWKYPLWWAESGVDRFPDVNKAKTKELDIGIKYSSSLGDYLNEEQIISNALIVNSHAEPDGKILYQNGLIPVGNTSYWGIYPSKIIEHKDRWIDHFEFIPERSFSGKRYDAGVRCNGELLKDENNGCITVIAAKKYGSIKVNADVFYNFIKILYEREYCINGIVGYYQMFDSLELDQIADLNKSKDNWHSIASNSILMYKFVTLKELSSLPNYFPIDGTHNAFLEKYKYLTNTYRGGIEVFNNDMDSILIDRFKYLPNTLDSVSKLIDKNSWELNKYYGLLYEATKMNDQKSMKETFKILEDENRKLQDYLKVYNKLSELKSAIDKQINYYTKWCADQGGIVNSKTKKISDLLNHLESTSDRFLKDNLQKRNISDNKIKLEKYMDDFKSNRLDNYIDSLLSLETGSLLRFTPYYIDYIDERTDKKTVLTNPVVLVKKIRNIDRKSILVKVILLPIPNGFNSQYMRADYSLKPEAEVVLPISEFEGYPGSSSINQMNSLIDSMR